MDLSITDLLVKIDAPAAGPRGPGLGAGRPLSGASIAAFNDLLDQYATRVRPEAPARDAGRPAVPERANARDDAEGVRRSERDQRAPRNNTDAAPSDTPETTAPSDAETGTAVRSRTKAESPEEPATDDAPTDLQADTNLPAQVPAPSVVTADVRASSVTESTGPEEATDALPLAALSDIEPGATAVQSQTDATPATPKTAASPQANAATAQAVPSPQAQGLTTDDGTAGSPFAAALAKDGQAGPAPQAKAPTERSGHAPDHASAALLRAASVSVEEARLGGEAPPQLPPGLLIAQEMANGKGIAHAIQMAGGSTGASGQAGNGQAAASTAAIAQQAQHGSAGPAPALQPGQSEIERPAPVPVPAGPALTTPGSAALPGNSGGHGQVDGISMHGPVQTTAPGAGGASSQAAASARAPQPVPVPLDQVSVHIAKAAASGSDHISIKLKPAALGQVDVKLEVTHDGRVAAVVTVDRADTLDMLQRDAKGLERALQDAGLKTDSDSLQFNLRGDGQTAARHDDGAGRAPDAPSIFADTPDDDPSTAQAGYVNRREAAGGIDIRV